MNSKPLQQIYDRLTRHMNQLKQISLDKPVTADQLEAVQFAIQQLDDQRSLVLSVDDE